jgi:sirohydrochlorin ferrochelatase
MNKPAWDQPTPSHAKRTAILLIAHGSRQEAANRDLTELATRIEATGQHPIVEGSFLELAQPDIPTGGDRCVARGAASAGIHLERDLSAARDELSRRHPQVTFHLGAPLGPHPLLDQLVAVRIHELEERVSIAD